MGGAQSHSNSSDDDAEENTQCFVDRLHHSSLPEDKEKMVAFGVEKLKKLQRAILATYPFLKNAKESACMVDLRLKDQPLIYVNDQVGE